jgi:hypothetical protein
MLPRLERLVCIVYCVVVIVAVKMFYELILESFGTRFLSHMVLVAFEVCLTLELCLYAVLHDQLGRSIHLPVFQGPSAGALPVSVSSHFVSNQPPCILSEYTWLESSRGP